MTVATKEAAPLKSAVPVMTPVSALMLSPVGNSVVDETEAMDQCKAPVPPVAFKVALYEWPCSVFGNGEVVVMVGGVEDEGFTVLELPPPPPPQAVQKSAEQIATNIAKR